ncbi:hydroxypyruvate isomerase family protein [Massiliimalia timonensis]|uniref:hydroxypyruvate isomerase family protein n=1 Tax=Massiliimalia timonensis TaxID=1987501 RepID=UPI00189CE7B7|nr:TIM barrel protein [Massiliimalia timonensis]
MNYSVCIDALYHGKDFVEGMRETKEAGLDAFEFWSWWDKDLDQIVEEKEKLGLTVAAMCTKFFSLVDPKEHESYLAGLEESIAAAKKLGCKTLISQVGADTGEAREKQYAALLQGVKKAVPVLEENGVTLVLEPLNTAVDHAGYYLSSSKEAFLLAKEAGSENVKILFDIYHQQITEGDVIRSIRENISLIGHFHAAGNPGRHEIDTGELNYPNIFRVIQETGYTGYMGLEYFPVKPALEGLQKLPR